ncbi:unnamed protein product [Toxocara canis]|uniref:Btz domain-containing protein n=1 Tax=Toxocara canis TaxID=6265 RepID=A0A183UP29_TOXCA|nr:unnamed protein product [Toxocara canis]
MNHCRKSKVGKSARTHRRLNDLDVDEMTESDSEEYQASENESEVSEGISDGSEEYIPSDEGKRLSSEEDSTSEEEESEFESEESSAEDVTRRKAVAKRRWAPRASSSEDDFDEPRKTQTGRPLRKAVANAKKVEEEQEDEEDESSEGHKKNERPVCARRRRISSDEGDFEPDEEEQEEDEDEEEEADEDEHESEEEQKGIGSVTASKEHDEEPSEKESAKGKGEVEKVESQQEANAEKHDQAESSANPELQKNKKEGEAKKEIKEETEVSKSPHRESVASSHLPQVRQIKAERRLSSSSQSPGPPPITLIASVPVSYSIIVDYNFCDQKLRPLRLFRVASTSTDANVMHPSTVIQQMARLAAPTSMARYPQPAQTAMMFPARGVLPPGVQVPISNPYAAYPPPDKVPYIAASAPNLYGVRPPAYMKPPNVPPGYGPPPPEEWNPYATAPNVFATSGASAMMMPIPPGVPAVAPGTLPVSDADSLGNALASAMDY